MKNNWSTIIASGKKDFSLNISETWKYRDLIKLFVHRDFVTFYKQTILGPVWFIIQPLFTAGIFTLIFGNIAKISTDGLPKVLFYLSGVINWSFFSETLTNSSKTFLNNANLFGKVYFPRLTVPIANIISGSIKYSIQYLLFIGFLLNYYFKGESINPSWMIVFTPLILMQIGMLGFGCGIWIASITAKYRDLSFVLPFFIQLWMYATPIVYPLSMTPDRFKAIISFNPMVSLLELFKLIYLGVGSFDINYYFINLAVTLVILISGLILFNRIEKNFMDTI